MNEKIIEFKNVVKKYENNIAINNMNFEVNRGEILGFLGPNGSGKTTSVRLMNGVIFPDSGSITVKGFDTIKNGDDIRKISGVLTETAALYENFTVYENLNFFAQLYGVEAGLIDNRINFLLNKLKLENKRNAKFGGLSTGMKKRIEIAKALLHNPKLLFLDEPTSGLDPESARDVINYIKELNSEDVTVFVCTHNLSEAEHFCSRFIFLDSGRIVEQGTISEIKNKYASTSDLKITFKGNLDDAPISGHNFEILNKNSIVLKSLAETQIPTAIRQLSQKIDIYEVTPLNDSLEALYFKIIKLKGVNHEQKNN